MFESLPMSDEYKFNVPGISCESCVSVISNVFTLDEFKKTGLIVESHYIDVASKTIKIKIKNSTKKKEDVIRLLRESIASTGFHCITMKEEGTLVELPLYQKILTSHWFLGGFGTGSGIALLVLMTFFSGGLSVAAMVAIGLVSTVFTLLLGAPFYREAVVRLVKSRTLTMDTLFTISTLTVIAVSLAAFAFPWLPMMFEAGLLIFGFRYLGLAIEKSVSGKIVTEKKFRDRAPLLVTVITENNDKVQRKLSTIVAGDLIELKAGDIVPVDGECETEGLIYDTILSGAVFPHSVSPGTKLLAGMKLAEDASPIILKATPIILALKAGDTIPVDGVCEKQSCLIEDEESQSTKEIKIDDPLFAGSRLASPAKLNVTAVANYSYLERLDRNIAEAQFEKAPIQEATTAILQYFIPTVILLAIISGCIMGAFFPPALALQCAISVLVAACPCTLGLITPFAVKIGMNKAADNGVQFKSAKALQSAADVNAVVCDVHGTLTEGIPQVERYAFDPKLIDEKKMLSYLAALENESQHPIAKAIVKYLNDKDIETLSVTEVDKKNHSGLKAKILENNNQETVEKELIVGDQSMMQSNEIDVSYLQNQIKIQGGQSITYLACDKKIVGYMILKDPLRKDALEAINLLRKQGKKIFLCTGAAKTTAMTIGKLLDIANDNICYDCVATSETEQDNSKTAFIAKLIAQGYKVAMVGDSANDSNALTKAALGIAVKSQSGDEITQQQAGAVIEGKSLLPLVNLFTIANQTVSNIKQNLGFSLTYNMITTLVVGGLLTALSVVVNPAAGVLLMILQLSLILANAYRFKLQKLDHLENKPEAISHTPSYGVFDKFISNGCTSELSPIPDYNNSSGGELFNPLNLVVPPLDTSMPINAL